MRLQTYEKCNKNFSIFFIFVKVFYTTKQTCIAKNDWAERIGRLKVKRKKKHLRSYIDYCGFSPD